MFPRRKIREKNVVVQRVTESSRELIGGGQMDKDLLFHAVIQRG